MRIAHVIHGWPAPSMGGTGLYVEALGQALVQLGHTVAVVGPVADDSAGGAVSLAGGVEGWKIPVPLPTRWSETWNSEHVRARWVQWSKRWKPDVVHFHHLDRWSLDLPLHTEATTVLTLHDYAIPCARGQWVDHTLSLCEGPSPERCARCLRMHLRHSPLTGTIGRLLSHFPAARTSAGRALETTGSRRDLERTEARLFAAKACLTGVDHLLSPSQDLIDRITPFAGRAPTLTALPLLRPAGEMVTPPPGPVRFLFASSIIPTKGPDQLVAAFAGLGGGATLTIAGQAPGSVGQPGFADALRARAESIPGIHWRGHVAPDAIPHLMSQHDVLVLPSIWPENSPLVVREATAAGLRVVLGPTGGARELAPNATVAEAGFSGLVEALRTERDRGRTRCLPQTWPTPQEHAATLLASVYSPC
jgi:glycosyltransferase involved in cell wall biosynthesis